MSGVNTLTISAVSCCMDLLSIKMVWGENSTTNTTLPAGNFSITLSNLRKRLRPQERQGRMSSLWFSAATSGTGSWMTLKTLRISTLPAVIVVMIILPKWRGIVPGAGTKFREVKPGILWLQPGEVQILKKLLPRIEKPLKLPVNISRRKTGS